MVGDNSYTVEYVCPQTGLDRECLILTLEEFGAVDVESSDANTITGTWPSKDHEEVFNDACVIQWPKHKKVG